MHTHVATPRAGLSKQQAGGALTKLKLDNAGIVSVLYEQVRPRVLLLGCCWPVALSAEAMTARSSCHATPPATHPPISTA